MDVSAGKTREFGGLEIDQKRQLLYVTDRKNGEILRINYPSFIYEEYHAPEVKPEVI
jgi:hypothetical protein